MDTAFPVHFPSLVVTGSVHLFQSLDLRCHQGPTCPAQDSTAGQYIQLISVAFPDRELVSSPCYEIKESDAQGASGPSSPTATEALPGPGCSAPGPPCFRSHALLTLGRSQPCPLTGQMMTEHVCRHSGRGQGTSVNRTGYDTCSEGTESPVQGEAPWTPNTINTCQPQGDSRQTQTGGQSTKVTKPRSPQMSESRKIKSCHRSLDETKET